ncbi:hypothetical protein [Streptomyces sp. NPDC059979]|uniref:hypothetical protein n=1 Tax=unclassified Streptomyces TaxID=2593676 RepID=UPI003654503C
MAAIAVVAAATGCTGQSGNAGPAPRRSVAAPPPLVITQAEAEKVFSRFEWERRTPSGWKAADAVAKVVTGPLMAEWHAHAAVRAVAKRPEPVVAGLVNPAFAIPAERDQPSYPRSFVVFSKANGREDGPATAVHYFVQQTAGAEWQAAVETWVATTAAVPLDTENVWYAPTAVQIRKTPIATISRDGTGTAVLSPTADADRAACGRFADYMSFTTPDAKPKNEQFAPGPLSDEMLRKLGEKPKHPGLNGLVNYTFEHAVSGLQLPVLKLDNGASLVACPLVRAEQMKGEDSTVSFNFSGDSDRTALLDAEGKWWRRVDAKLSLTALIELPPSSAPGPAEVAACNCFDPQLLEVTGKPR